MTAHLSDCDSLWVRWCFCPGTPESFCGIPPAAPEAVVGKTGYNLSLHSDRGVRRATHMYEVVSVVVFFGSKVIEVCRVLVLQGKGERSGIVCRTLQTEEETLKPWCSPVSSRLLRLPPWGRPASPGGRCWSDSGVGRCSSRWWVSQTVFCSLGLLANRPEGNIFALQHFLTFSGSSL